MILKQRRKIHRPRNNLQSRKIIMKINLKTDQLTKLFHKKMLKCNKKRHKRSNKLNLLLIRSLKHKKLLKRSKLKKKKKRQQKRSKPKRNQLLKLKHQNLKLRKLKMIKRMNQKTLLLKRLLKILLLIRILSLMTNKPQIIGLSMVTILIMVILLYQMTLILEQQCQVNGCLTA